VEGGERSAQEVLADNCSRDQEGRALGIALTLHGHPYSHNSSGEEERIAQVESDFRMDVVNRLVNETYMRTVTLFWLGMDKSVAV
jgi:hypothetical protein